MVSATSVLYRIPWTFFLNRGKSIRDKVIIKKIIQKTIPDEGFYKILDVGCGDGNRLKEAAGRNPFLHGVGLVRREKDIPVPWENPAEKQQIKILVSEILQFRAQPEFDVLYLFEWLACCPEKQRVEILQYCRMLLKPGGLLVTVAAKNSKDPKLRPTALRNLLKSAGLYKNRSLRLTTSLRLLTAERIK